MTIVLTISGTEMNAKSGKDATVRRVQNLEVRGWESSCALRNSPRARVGQAFGV